LNCSNISFAIGHALLPKKNETSMIETIRTGNSSLMSYIRV